MPGIQLATGQTAKAIETCREVADNPKVNVRLLRKLAWCYIEADLNANAIDIYKRIVSMKRASYEDWNNLGVACLRAGKMKSAQKALTAAISTAPDRPEAKNNMGMVLPEAKRLRRGIGILQPGR